MKAIHRRAAGAATTRLVSAGALLVAPTAASASAQSCTVSRFTVVRPVAGAYVDNGDGTLVHFPMYDKRLADPVDGPTGGSNGYWTTVYLEGDWIAYMRDPALRYDSCEADAGPRTGSRPVRGTTPCSRPGGAG